jgi:hypothetical protein
MAPPTCTCGVSGILKRCLARPRSAGTLSAPRAALLSSWLGKCVSASRRVASSAAMAVAHAATAGTVRCHAARYVSSVAASCTSTQGKAAGDRRGSGRSDGSSSAGAAPPTHHDSIKDANKFADSSQNRSHRRFAKRKKGRHSHSARVTSCSGCADTSRRQKRRTGLGSARDAACWPRTRRCSASKKKASAPERGTLTRPPTGTAPALIGAAAAAPFKATRFSARSPPIFSRRQFEKKSKRSASRRVRHWRPLGAG